MIDRIRAWYFNCMLNKAIKKYVKCVLDDNIISEWSEKMDRLSKEIGKIEKENVEFKSVMNQFLIDIMNDDNIDGISIKWMRK